jgi:hypothetical protein
MEKKEVSLNVSDEDENGEGDVVLPMLSEAKPKNL